MLNSWKALLKSKDFYIRLTSTTLIISIVPILIISIISTVSFKRSFENELKAANIRYLKQTVNAVEIIMNQINSSCEQLVLDNNFKGFLQYPVYYENIIGEFKDEDLIRLYDYIDKKAKIFEKLRLFRLSNEFIQSVYIFDEKKGIILTSQGIQYSINDFYDKDWHEAILKNTDWPFYTETRLAKAQDENYKQTFSVVYRLFDNNNNTFIINLDAEKIQKSIIEKLDNRGANEAFLIVSNKGNAILSSVYNKESENINKIISLNSKNISDSYTTTFNKRDIMVNYITSSILNWKFVSVIDVEAFYKGIYGVIKITLLISTILLALTAIFAIFSCYKIYNPISSIIKFIKGNQKEYSQSNENILGEIKMIGSSLEGAFKDRENLKIRLKESLPIFREKFIGRLVKKSIENLDEVKLKMNYLNIDIDYKNLIVLVLEVYHNKFYGTSIEKMNIDKLLIIEVIERKLLIKYKSVVAEMEEDKYVVILNCSENDIEDALYMAQELNEELSKLSIFSTIGIGSYCSDIDNLAKSYNEAEEALQYRSINDANEVIYIKDVTLNYKQRFIYPKDRETELNNHIRKGDIENAKTTLNSITESIENHQPKLHYHYAQQIFIQLLSSMINTVYSMGMDIETIFSEDSNLYVSLMKSENITDISLYFKVVIEKICIFVKDTFDEKNNEHVQSIIEIVRNNCSGNITLCMVAEQLHMNPSYISRIFKQNMGKTFMEYLTDERLDKSRKLLVETNLTVKDIGVKLGYNNSYYFIKLFKENIGVTPGEYRKMYSS